MIRAELDRRTDLPPTEEPVKVDEDRYGTDGLLSAPFPGYPPFETPEKVLAEVTRTRKNLGASAQRIVQDMANRIRDLACDAHWKEVLELIDRNLEDSAP